MKDIDVSSQVMEKIVHYERRQVTSWFRRFYGVVIILLLLLAVLLWRGWQTLSDLQSWAVLDIFWEDWEIISDFWQDTVMTFLAELPMDIVFMVLFVLAGVCVLFVITRKRTRHETRAQLNGHGTAVNGIILVNRSPFLFGTRV